MTLKDKFENILHNWIDKDYDRQNVANELEIDADDFAIGFAEWMLGDDSWRVSEETLENYKKEKGL